jgi:hypothetical protein
MPNGLFDWLSARIGSDFVKATLQNVQQLLVLPRWQSAILSPGGIGLSEKVRQAAVQYRRSILLKEMRSAPQPKASQCPMSAVCCLRPFPPCLIPSRHTLW